MEGDTYIPLSVKSSNIQSDILNTRHFRSIRFCSVMSRGDALLLSRLSPSPNEYVAGTTVIQVDGQLRRSQLQRQNTYKTGTCAWRTRTQSATWNPPRYCCRCCYSAEGKSPWYRINWRSETHSRLRNNLALSLQIQTLTF